MLGPPLPELSLLHKHAVREGQPRRRGHLDGDRVVACVHDAPVDQHRALLVIDCEACVLVAGHQEVAHVEARLKADDVAAQQPLEDRVAHVARQHLPVLRRRPWDVHEMRDDRAGQLAPDHLRHQVELVVVDHDQRPLGQLMSHLDDAPRDLAIDLDVTVGPRGVDLAVDVRLLRKVPQVVLDEPQDRVRDDRVVLVVLVARRVDVVKLGGRAAERRHDSLALLLDHVPLGLGAHARHPVRRSDLGECQQRGDHAARTTRESSFRSRLVRRAIADDHRGAVRQRARDVIAHGTAGSAALDALQERAISHQLPPTSVTA